MSLLTYIIKLARSYHWILLKIEPDYGKVQDAANGENGTVDPNATSDSPVSLIVAKNRNGRLATIDFMFQKHIGRFVEMDQQH